MAGVLEVVDPDNVREIFVTGIAHIGTIKHDDETYLMITHTISRPDINSLYAGRNEKPKLVVCSRLIMSQQRAASLVEAIQKALKLTNYKPKS